MKKVADIPEDFQPKPLGQRIDLIKQIREVVPEAEFTNPEWGVLDAGSFSVEFMMGSSEICASITLLVRGGGNPASLVAFHFPKGLGCRTVIPCELWQKTPVPKPSEY